mmetsp:Transcript_36756/g.123104  ORF Transcript_36756/g.123104 Transcript_36756/m.123104 type:complete len:243 (+) Transcript_36756:69-797(+)
MQRLHAERSHRGVQPRVLCGERAPRLPAQRGRPPRGGCAFMRLVRALPSGLFLPSFPPSFHPAAALLAVFCLPTPYEVPACGGHSSRRGLALPSVGQGEWSARGRVSKSGRGESCAVGCVLPAQQLQQVPARAERHEQRVVCRSAGRVRARQRADEERVRRVGGPERRHRLRLGAQVGVRWRVELAARLEHEELARDAVAQQVHLGKGAAPEHAHRAVVGTEIARRLLEHVRRAGAHARGAG